MNLIPNFEPYFKYYVDLYVGLALRQYNIKFQNHDTFNI